MPSQVDCTKRLCLNRGVMECVEDKEPVAL